MIAERRDPHRADRRQKASPWYAFRGGRRKGPRRGGDGHASADGLSRPVVMVAALLMFFCLIDALATLHLLGRGCDEANPAMRLLLDRGDHAFLLGKVALTGAGVVFLLNFRYHRFFASCLRIGHLLIALTGLYAALNFFQAVLLVIA